jgi:hypothetical protein
MLSICVFYRWVKSVSEFLTALHDSPCMHQQKVESVCEFLTALHGRSEFIFDHDLTRVIFECRLKNM